MGSWLAPLPLVCAAGLALAACSLQVYEGRYDHDEGWRVARVLSVADAATFGTRTGESVEDCRGQLDAGTLESATLALVRYREGRAERYRLAVVSAEHPVAALQFVYVNVRDCGKALAPFGHEP